MNGSAFGGLAEGIAGGMNNTMSLMDLAQKKKDKAAQVSSDVSGEKMGLQDTPEPEGGDIVSDSWSTLKGIVGDLAGGAALGSTPAGGIIESGMKNSIAGKLLGGGIGNTIIGKLGGDKLLSKGLVGGLLK